ncbi:UDP-N-acetylmuramoyl-L-alanyl-D-glutamate--2,6-diaminopimelate ligase [Candidatus Saccharibacteria bacterium]|nr:UDP-N-acetylmuramoyl-L-alanyl-D-glutamate--2,6-diaminopimelate ligase [Candidatus Saccharibacteria bacterium]
MSFRRLVKVAIPTGIFKKIEPFGHLGEAVLLNLICGFPGRRLKVIGVTGTNGKTTTSFLIHRMMHEAGYKVGLMTTVAYGVGVDIKPQVEHMTTVSVPQLLRRLKTLRSEGAEWLVLETTSHSLAQHRVWGVPFSIAVMTNITHEHLDYHGSFENYRAAKLKMFKMAGRNRKGMRLGIVNADDPAADSFQQATPNSFSYGIKRGELKASDIKMSAAGNSFTARSAVHDGLNLNIRTHLPGSFNIHNSLAAIAVGLKLEIEQTAIEKGIASLSGVEGRMATVNAGQNFDVIVDYAHTPDSFEKLFSDLRPMIKGKMIVMFGSAGRRDEAKRAIQGNIAGRYADVVVVTEEDDRDIDGTEIMDQIAGGAQKAGKTRDKDLFLVHDRAAAIKFALSKASKGDTVLLLGKGHEKTIARAHGEDSWDEVATAQKILTVKR